MTKEQERSALFSTIWRVANDLRGSVDGWDFKQYVFSFLFYRFLSESLTNYINVIQRADANTPDFDYAGYSDAEAEKWFREEIIKLKGYFILPSELFCNLAARAERDNNLNITVDTVFKNITSSANGTNAEDNIKGLFDNADLTDSKLGATPKDRRERLLKIIKAIQELRLSGAHHERQIDVFGDAYEYLMGMYAASAGKSGGEFFTPQEVSELLAHIAIAGKSSVNKVYDPACGSGSLLLKFAKILGKDNIESGFYGQEISLTTYNLCRMNMYLHDINYAKFHIAHGDTLTEPKHWDDEPFEAIVSNPPYSIKWAGDSSSVLMNDECFAPAGVLAPKSKADMAFVMHCLSRLAENGTAAIVCFPGVMYRGGAEQKIRKYLVDYNYVDCVIALPINLFFGTSIATNILVLKKNRQTDKVLFIDASAKFTKGTNQNHLDNKSSGEILDAFETRAEITHFTALADKEAIAAKDYNLSVSSYVEAPDTREKIDIKALNAEIAALVEQEQVLRGQIDAIVRELEGEAA